MRKKYKNVSNSKERKQQFCKKHQRIPTMVTIIIIITVQSHITARISEELEARKTSCSNTHDKDNEKGKRSKIPYKEIVCDCVFDSKI